MGLGDLSDNDAEIVMDFAEFLRLAGPPPVEGLDGDVNRARAKRGRQAYIEVYGGLPGEGG